MLCKQKEIKQVLFRPGRYPRFLASQIKYPLFFTGLNFDGRYYIFLLYNYFEYSWSDNFSWYITLAPET